MFGSFVDVLKARATTYHTTTSWVFDGTARMVGNGIVGGMTLAPADMAASHPLHTSQVSVRAGVRRGMRVDPALPKHV